MSTHARKLYWKHEDEHLFFIMKFSSVITKITSNRGATAVQQMSTKIVLHANQH